MRKITKRGTRSTEAALQNEVPRVVGAFDARGQHLFNQLLHRGWDEIVNCHESEEQTNMPAFSEDVPLGRVTSSSAILCVLKSFRFFFDFQQKFSLCPNSLEMPLENTLATGPLSGVTWKGWSHVRCAGVGCCRPTFCPPTWTSASRGSNAKRKKRSRPSNRRQGAPYPRHRVATQAEGRRTAVPPPVVAGMAVMEAVGHRARRRTSVSSFHYFFFSLIGALLMSEQTCGVGTGHLQLRPRPGAIATPRRARHVLHSTFKIVLLH